MAELVDVGVEDNQVAVAVEVIMMITLCNVKHVKHRVENYHYVLFWCGEGSATIGDCCPCRTTETDGAERTYLDVHGRA